MSKQPFDWEKCKQTEPPGLALLNGKVVTVIGPRAKPSNLYYFVHSGDGHGEIAGKTVRCVSGGMLSNLPEEPEKPDLKPVDVAWYEDEPPQLLTPRPPGTYSGCRVITVDPNLATMEEMAEAGIYVYRHTEPAPLWDVYIGHTRHATFLDDRLGGKLPALRAAREYATKLVNEARR